MSDDRQRFFEPFAGRPRPQASELLTPAAGGAGNRLRAVLASTGRADLTPPAVRSEVQGNLWMLAPAAYRYFLPAFMSLALEHYEELATFAGELIRSLTKLTREDIAQDLDRAAAIPAGMGIPADTMQQLRRQQLEWYDSGSAVNTYRERMDGLSAGEEAAVVAFLVAMRDTHGEDFPLGDPQTAIDRREAEGQHGAT